MARAANPGRRRVDIKIPDDLSARLLAVAAAEGERPSTIIRRAIGEYLARQFRPTPPATGATQRWDPNEVGRPDEWIGDGLGVLQRFRDGGV